MLKWAIEDGSKRGVIKDGSTVYVSWLMGNLDGHYGCLYFTSALVN